MMDKVTADIEAIKNALIGTEFGDKGLAKRVEDNERDISHVKTEFLKYKWIAFGISITASVIFNLLAFMIK